MKRTSSVAKRGTGRSAAAVTAVAVVAAVAVIGAITACGPLARSAFRTPTVELRDIRVRGIGLEGGSLDLVLDVYNPNDYRIDATRLTYRFYADTAQGRPTSAPSTEREGLIATGEVTRRVTLENRAHNDVTLPLTFTMRELMGAAAVLLRNGSVDYRVAGEVTLDTPFGSITRPYEGKARFDNLMVIPRF